MEILDPARHDEARALSARAFDADPFFNFVAPEDETRAELLRALMGSFMTLAPTRAHLVSGALAGVAIWLPPGAYPTATLPTLRVRGLEGARWVARRPAELLRLGWLLRIGQLLDEAHPRRPYYYLQLLAVDPVWQGRGVGRALLDEALAEADRDGLPAVLETSKPENVGFYRRFGFAITRASHVASSPPIWTMVRPPARPRPEVL